MNCIETHSANPWEITPGSDNYVVEVRTFLEDYAITVYTIAILNPDGEPVCLACNCLTSRNIVISTQEDDQEKAEELGFTVQLSGLPSISNLPHQQLIDIGFFFRRQ